MEGIQKAFRSAMSQADPNGSFSSISSALEKAPIKSSASVSSADQSQLLLTRSSRQVVSLWTCSKLCAICFVAGIFVGYTLKRRVRRWASKFLKGLKD
uniref:Putative ovule protein n=1 Tax=Solanum chacoense TaxID=4108 RepID=A0A0V0GUF2_SOLCH